MKALCLPLLVVLAAACNDVQRGMLTGRVKPYRIPTTSMEPTIKNGEMAYADLSPSYQPVRGDVIVFHDPFEPKTMMAKRVLGMPGERLEIRSKRLFINDAPVADPHAVHVDEMVFDRKDVPEPYRSRDNFGPFRVPADAYFVLGDNRDRSADSRWWGSIPAKLVIGKIIATGPRTGPLRPVQ